MLTNHPREGMMAVVRNRRSMITSVQPYDSGEQGRYHLVEVEYSDSIGLETEQLLWEVESEAQVLEPSALPDVHQKPPMNPLEFDAMVRASRWSALTPSLPFSGLDEDRPPVASPLYGAIYPEAYQLVPVLRALEMPRVALMLADAVGLGKTIQAGMILRELMLRRRIRRILVLCPAALRTQWAEEMNEKFSLPFDVVDRAGTLKLQREQGLDASPWRNSERIITSYHYLKQPDVLEQFRSTAEPHSDGRLRWDLLIVDEAHNLAPASFGKDSDLSEMLQRISPWFEHRIFLSATPHNGHTRSFSGLLEALDPVQFTRKSELNEKDRQRISGTVIRRLKSEINDCYTSSGQPAHFSERFVEALPALRFSSAEKSLLQAMDRFRTSLKRLLRGTGHQDRMAATFAVEVLQKRLLSGPWAFGQSWLALMEGLRSEEEKSSSQNVVKVRELEKTETDNDEERESRQTFANRTVGAWLRQWQGELVSEIEEVENAVNALGVERTFEDDESSVAVSESAVKVASDARFDRLDELVEDKLRKESEWVSDERLVVFTEYLATLEYLQTRLLAKYGEGDWLVCLYGGMKDSERDAVKHAFNDPDGNTRILLATDAAGEGLNLQRVARYMLHWDIPWNPSRMEQRNGRLDRHGQKRDVTIFHFDSTDDNSIRFLGRVLRKRSQTREDRVVTDEIFSDAIFAHFEDDLLQGRDPNDYLEQVVTNARKNNSTLVEELPSGLPLPGAEDLQRLNSLKEELDVSPDSLCSTLETTLALKAGRPRFRTDEDGRERFVFPIPAEWQELVDSTLRKGSSTGPLLSMVFDPSHYIKTHNGQADGRPVYTPEPDSRLLHLGDPLFHRVMSTFARYRFPGGPSSATRWTVKQGSLPDGMDALLLLSVEELGINQLREPCHHWVRTFAFPIVDEVLQAPLSEDVTAQLPSLSEAGDRDEARDLWEEVEEGIKLFVSQQKEQLNLSLRERLKASGEVVREKEKKRFAQRERELKTAIGTNQRARLEKEAEKLRKKTRQMSLFSEIDQELQKKLSDLQAELDLRKGHYEQLQIRLQDERERLLKKVLPKRYSLRDKAQVYPIAIEFWLPGGAS